MFSEKDKAQIAQRGSELNTVLKQIGNFKKGFPYLHIEAAASVGKGIIKLDENSLEQSCSFFDEKIEAGVQTLKFVPASGAASRMFKALFEALESCGEENAEEILQNNKATKEYIENIEKFAFYQDLIKKIKVQNLTVNWKN